MEYKMKHDYTNYSMMSQDDEQIIENTQESYLDEMALNSEVEDTVNDILEESSTAEVENSEYLMAKVCNCNQVYLREYADKNSTPLKILDLGEEILLEKEEDSWCKVFTSEGIEGFIMKDFVEII